MRIAACVALLLSWPCLAQARQAAPASAPAAGPQAEEGRPFIRNYRPREVSGEGQNWAIVQDARGVIYVGSNAGVIEYDGATWRLIETPTIDTVRSLDIDANGRIYAGSVSEFGYLAPDAVGKLQWVSLLNRVPADAREFGDVWRTFATPAGVIFQTNRVIFRLANDKISVIRPTARMGRASFLDGQLYATVADSGLNVLEGDHFRKLPGTEALAREPFPVVLRYDQRHLLIGTRSNGLFLYDGASLAPFATDGRRAAETEHALSRSRAPRRHFRAGHDERRIRDHRSAGPSTGSHRSGEWPGIERRVLHDARSGRGALAGRRAWALARRNRVTSHLLRSG